MKCLLVTAHPLADSLCGHLARRAADALSRAGHEVALEDLYAQDFPAALKGWFDRVWSPGIAYDHADDLGPIRPRLHKLKRVLAVTTLGSPWWVDWLVLRRPVRRVLKRAILGACAPRARFEIVSLYKAEKLAPERVEAFLGRMERDLAGWA